MRIRQIKPAFFKDARIAELTPSVRLFYIGLWMLADDAGWLAWDVAEVGNELYGYEARGRRERNVASYLEKLVAAKRVTVHDCGHVEIPTFTEHQRLSGSTKQVQTVFREHRSRCSPQIPADARGSSQSPALEQEQERERGTGSERSGKGTVARERANEEERLPAFLQVVSK